MSAGVTTMRPTDERGGYPSASGFERLYLCRGSWNLEKDLPPERQTDDAYIGNLIHDALAKDNYSKLDDDDKDMAERCERQRAALAKAMGFDEENITPIYEQRLWLMDDKLKPVLSGQFDYVLIQGERALLVDYKTGRGDVPESASNWQLRVGAVLLRDHFNVTSVTVAIVQPWVSSTPDVCEYGEEDLEKSRALIFEIVAESRRTDAPRTPSLEACKYCRAKAVCPEAQGNVMAMAAVPSDIIARMDGDRLAVLLDKKPLVQKILDAIEAEAKRRLMEDSTSVHGWRLKVGAERRTITNAQAAFQRAGIPAEKFADCCTVKIAQLESAFAEARGIKKKDAKAALAEALGDVIEVKQSAPTLEREAA